MRTTKNEVADNILGQVANTTITISTHVTGHFISAAQLRALREALAFESPSDSTPSPTVRRTISAERFYLTAKRAEYRERLALAEGPEKTRINNQLQHIASRLAKLSVAAGDD